MAVLFFPPPTVVLSFPALLPSPPPTATAGRDGVVAAPRDHGNDAPSTTRFVPPPPITDAAVLLPIMLFEPAADGAASALYSIG